MSFIFSVKVLRSILLAIVLIALMIIFLTQRIPKPPSSLQKGPLKDQSTNEIKAEVKGDSLEGTAVDSVVPRGEKVLDFENLPKVETLVASSDMTRRPAKIGIITFFSKDAGSQALKELTFGNFQEYAGRHGYDAIDALENPFIEALFIDYTKKFSVTHFFKFHVMAYYLSRYDWILWADGDSIFLNQGIKIEDVVDENYDSIFTINTKEEPTWSLIINAGHYFLRNAPWTHRFLQEAIYMSQHRCQEFLYLVPGHRPPLLNNWIQLCGADGGYWLADQGVLQLLILYKGQDYRCHMKFVGFREFNSEFPWYEEGDFIVHFPGRSLQERQKLVPIFLRNVNKDTGLLNPASADLALIKPVVNPSNAKNMYDQYYAQMNMPCVLYNTLVHPKVMSTGNPLIIESNVGPLLIPPVPAAFQLPEGIALATNLKKDSNTDSAGAPNSGLRPI